MVGVTYRTRQCQQAIRNKRTSFNPEGLDEWIILQKQQTNKTTKDLIDKIEISLQTFVIEELKNQFGENDKVLWYEGVPGPIRTKVSARMEDDKNRRSGKEYYFDLIDYKKVIVDNWQIFENILGFGK